MPTHDAYLRTTPYELAFPRREVLVEHAARIRKEVEEGAGEEAVGEESPLNDPGRFLSLVSASRALTEFRPPGESSEGIHSYGLLLYHAVHFLEAGEPLYLLTSPVARYLVETPSRARETEGPPTSAGYLQLPRYLFWARPTDDDTPEPVDGLFWTAPGDGRLSILVACGLREDRPGLSVILLPSLPLKDAGRWLEAKVREEGRDFETTLPGGEMERLYSLEAAGEVLKLLARFFVYVSVAPEALVENEPPASEGVPESGDGEDLPRPSEGEPRPSELSYRRVRLSDGDRREEPGHPGSGEEEER